MFDTTEGIVKVYKDAGYEYYIDVDNRYEETFDNEVSYKKFMDSIKANFVKCDHD